MARVKLVDVTKLPKSAELVMLDAEALLAQAKASLERQKQFMEQAGMDRQKLREYMSSDPAGAKEQHKVRQELVRFHGELKDEMKEASDEMRKRLTLSANLLRSDKPKPKKPKSTVRRGRTGFI